jgi:hypothetical protein
VFTTIRELLSEEVLVVDWIVYLVLVEVSWEFKKLTGQGQAGISFGSLCATKKNEEINTITIPATVGIRRSSPYLDKR